MSIKLNTLMDLIEKAGKAAEMILGEDARLAMDIRDLILDIKHEIKTEKVGLKEAE